MKKNNAIQPEEKSVETQEINQENSSTPSPAPNVKIEINQNEPSQIPQPGQIVYDKDGNPIFIPKPTTYQPKPEKKIGAFVASIITLILSIITTIFAIILSIQFVQTTGSDAADIVLFIIYIFSGIGLLVFLPGFGFSIAAISCSAVACKSANKAIKAFAIINTILSVICLISIVIVPFLLTTLLRN